MNDEKLRLLLSYPDRGWAVFPCFPRQKTPATPNGFHDAVTEKDQITKWYKNNPDYNWGLVTGKQSGLLVIDLDAKGDGLKGWNNLVAANGLSEPTVTVQTGGGGTHLWFALPEKLKINRKIRWKPGIDVLGDGGYILVPPSQTLKLYEFEVHPDEVELAPLPDWLLEKILNNGNRLRQTSNRKFNSPEESIKEGNRNDFLTKMAGKYRAQGYEVDHIQGQLLVDNDKYCDPPLDEREVERIAESVDRYSPGTARGSQATRLVNLALDAGVELFRTPEDEPMARMPVAGHFEVASLRSRSFANWLSRLHYIEEHSAVGRETLTSARAVMEGTAQFEGDVHSVFARVAGCEDVIYLDMANDQWQAIRIDSKGWQIVNDPPVRFVRGAGMMPITTPEAGEDIEELLRPFVNVASEADFTLLVSWLLMAINPLGPYPVLTITGEQGSAKSTLSRIMRSLVDPNKAPLRTKPRNERDLMITAQNSWIVSFDNLSRIQDWLSDAICRLATGGGFSTRGLYTDADEKLFTAKRPCIVNSIEELATRSDLLDRAIILYLPEIDKRERIPEAKFLANFKIVKPRILGALLDAVSAAIKNHRDVELYEVERMADFCEWVVAAEPALSWPNGFFMQSYRENRQDIHMLALESWPVANVLQEWIRNRDDQKWEGTAAELLEELKGKTTESIMKLRSWPKDATRLSGQLRRLAPNLREVGVKLEFRRTSNSRVIDVRYDIPDV